VWLGIVGSVGECVARQVCSGLVSVEARYGGLRWIEVGQVCYGCSR